MEKNPALTICSTKNQTSVNYAHPAINHQNQVILVIPVILVHLVYLVYLVILMNLTILVNVVNLD